MKQKFCIVLVGVVGLLCQRRLTVASPAVDDAAIFKGRCTPCHGDKGKGNPALGIPDFSNPKTLADLTNAEVIDTITNGRKGTIMPAWKGKLSEDEIAALASYVRSLGR
jgi:cytochrome c oxidase cbb3-type subunit 3